MFELKGTPLACVGASERAMTLWHAVCKGCRHAWQRRRPLLPLLSSYVDSRHSRFPAASRVRMYSENFWDALPLSSQPLPRQTLKEALSVWGARLWLLSGSAVVLRIMGTNPS